MQHSQHGPPAALNSSSAAAALPLILSELKGMPSTEIIATFNLSSCNPVQIQLPAIGVSLDSLNGLFKVGKINDSIKKTAPKDLGFEMGVRTV